MKLKFSVHPVKIEFFEKIKARRAMLKSCSATCERKAFRIAEKFNRHNP